VEWQDATNTPPVKQRQKKGDEMPKPVTGAGRGGKAQPIEVQRAKGNTAKKKLPALPDTSTALVNIDATQTPAVPEWCDTYGAVLWAEVWQAGRRHLSDKHDAILISLLVEKMQDRRKVREWLGSDPNNRWYTTANGQTVSHPSVKQIEQMDAQITAWLSMLGFSPSDRARLGLAEVRVANELDQFRKRKDATTSVRDTADILDI
jgi:P27 family predicted phage terminase small subunit